MPLNFELPPPHNNNNSCQSSSGRTSNPNNDGDDPTLSTNEQTLTIRYTQHLWKEVCRTNSNVRDCSFPQKEPPITANVVLAEMFGRNRLKDGRQARFGDLLQLQTNRGCRRSPNRAWRSSSIRCLPNISARTTLVLIGGYFCGRTTPRTSGYERHTSFQSREKCVYLIAGVHSFRKRVGSW